MAYPKIFIFNKVDQLFILSDKFYYINLINSLG